MRFAIDLEHNYTLISPENELMDKELVEALFTKIKEGLGASTLNGFIVDLANVSQLTNDAIHPLLCIQEAIDEQEGVLVFVNLQELVLQKVKQERIHLSINIASSMEDAIDMVDKQSMKDELLNEL